MMSLIDVRVALHRKPSAPTNENFVSVKQQLQQQEIETSKRSKRIVPNYSYIQKPITTTTTTTAERNCHINQN